MIAIPLAHIIVFSYMPMYGAQIAFRNYRIIDGIWGSPWVGFAHFRAFFNSVFFFRLFRNTLVISGLQLAMTFPAAILMALMINELRNKRLKKGVQTVVYMPYFISVVVVAGIIRGVLAPNSGIINVLAEMITGRTIFFFNEPALFPWILAFSDVWQSTGFNSIIYLAAISSIDPGLYEATVMDGASRLKQIRHITLPALVPTIVILFILQIGGLFTIGFQRILLLYNPTIYSTADIIQTFVFRRGIGQQDFSYAAAIDIFNNTLNLIMLLFFNKLMRRFAETSLW